MIILEVTIVKLSFIFVLFMLFVLCEEIKENKHTYFGLKFGYFHSKLKNFLINPTDNLKKYMSR